MTLHSISRCSIYRLTIRINPRWDICVNLYIYHPSIYLIIYQRNLIVAFEVDSQYQNCFGTLSRESLNRRVIHRELYSRISFQINDVSTYKKKVPVSP